MTRKNLSGENSTRLRTAGFYTGIAALVLVPSAIIYMGQSSNADTELAHQKASIEADGFKVAGMPKSITKDVLGDIEQANRVNTVIDLGRCTVAVTAAVTLNSVTQLPKVYDYGFSKQDNRVVVQNHEQFQRLFGEEPCNIVDSRVMK